MTDIPRKWPGKKGVAVQLAKLRLMGIQEPRSWDRYDAHHPGWLEGVPYSKLSRKRQKLRWPAFREYVAKNLGTP